MKIETRFNAGDEVVILHNSKALNVKVHSLKIEHDEKATDLIYWFKIFDGTENSFSFETRPESQVFATKEELVKQL